MLVATSAASDDLAFAARTTSLQFQALKARLVPKDIVEEAATIPYRQRLRRSANFDSGQVSKWLANGWNTEYLLRLNVESLKEDALRHALHWAFPQAYYAALAVTLGYFKAVGFTEESHAGVIRKVGQEMESGHYPRTLSFLACGGKTQRLENLQPVLLASQFEFDASEIGCIDAHIARFLSATRRRDLGLRVKELQLKTKDGKKKKRFNEADMTVAGARLGPTSILSLLYRKRIKANYQDIDTFLHRDLNPNRVFKSLLRCVGALNFIHEAYLVKMVGADTYRAWVARLPADVSKMVGHRLDMIGRLG